MKNNKNKKGFTLVELLIVIVILISILGIAIINMNKISDSKKKEASKSVENQVITAAKEYFVNNEYLYNSLENGSYIIISVGKLVNEDYLNVVTNPETGLKVNNCDRVRVEKSSTGLMYTYEKYDGTCPENNVFTLTVTSPEAPMIVHEKINKSCTHEDGFTGTGKFWCKSDVDISIGIMFENGIETKYTVEKSIDGINFSSLDTSKKNTKKDKFKDDLEVNDEWTDRITEEKNHKIYYRAKNEYGESILDIEFGIDKTAPELDVYAYEADSSSKGRASVEERTASVIYDETWLNGYVWVNAESIDTISKTTLKYNRKKGLVDGKKIGSKEESDTEIAIPGLVARKKPCSYAEGISIYEFEACDEAGNCSEKITKTVKLDRTDPELNAYMYKGDNSSAGEKSVETQTATEKYDNNKWHSGYVWVKPDVKDTFSTVTLKYNRKKGSIGGSKKESAEEIITVGNNSKLKPYSKAEGISIYEFEACDEAGNCAEKLTKTVKLDRTVPDVSVTTETSSWVNTDVDYTANASDNIKLASLYSYWNKAYNTESDANSSECDWQSSSYGKGECKGDGSDSNLLNQLKDGKYSNRFSGSGLRKIKFKACDEAGNCATSDEAIARIDKSGPTISKFEVLSRDEGYNTRSAQVIWKIEDKYTTLGKISTNIKNKSGNSAWDRTSENLNKWNFTSNDKNYFILSDSYDGSSVTPKLTACDVLNNCTSKETDTYKVYKELECKIVKTTKPCDSKEKNLISGQVKVICNKKIESVKATYTYNTNSKSCKENSTKTYTPKNKYNAAVFNFRGCGGSYVLKEAKFEATDGVRKVTKTANGFNLKTDSSAEPPSCNPDFGSQNINY